MLRLALGALAVVVLGAAALAEGRRSAPRTVPGWLARSAAVGLTLAVVALVPLGLAGLPLSPLPLAGLLVALAAAALAASRRWPPSRPAPAEPVAPALAERPPTAVADRLAVAATALVVAALAVSIWKLALAPVWSWDHLAIWGMKARRLAAAGSLDTDFLAGAAFKNSVPQYPLGFPLALIVLALGGVIGAAEVKAVHALFVIGVVALVWEGAATLSRSRLAAAALAGLVAVSPLVWDSENLGLADVALAFWALAAVGFALRAAAEGGQVRDAVWAGVVAGFLPWLKEDGWPLLAALVAAVPLLTAGPPRRRLAAAVAAAVPAAVLALGAGLFAHFYLPSAAGFFAGDWWGRLGARLADPAKVPGPMWAELTAWDWLGFWALFAAGWAAAWALRRRPAVVLGGVVAAQFAVYSLVYFATFLDPAGHIRSSFFRVAGGQLPLAALALAPLLAAPATSAAPIGGRDE